MCAEMKESTFVHRNNGRRSAADYQKSQWLLTEEEEDVLVWRCEVLQRAGFAQTPQDITAVAEEILRKRDPNGTVGRRWVGIPELLYVPPRGESTLECANR